MAGAASRSACRPPPRPEPAGWRSSTGGRPCRRHATPAGQGGLGRRASRIALAIAVTTSPLGQAQTLIFDEVDSGVGGAVAETVGG
jgi:hypothetical protein